MDTTAATTASAAATTSGAASHGTARSLPAGTSGTGATAPVSDVSHDIGDSASAESWGDREAVASPSHRDTTQSTPEDLNAYMLDLGARPAPPPRRSHARRPRQERRPPRRRRRDPRSISRHPVGEPPGPRQRTIGWPRRPVARPAGAHRRAHPVDGGGPAPDRDAAGPRRRDRRDADAALRPSGRAHARAAGGDRDHLRVTAQRHCRRRRAMPEIRQRDHPARRLRSAGVEPRDCRVHPRGARDGRPAPRRGPGGRDQRSRRGRDTHRHGFARGRHRAEGRQGAH